jgi:NAD(P)-dependent dehydrogenase (short-subunit alcohol dehydrogenase family)
MKENYGGIDVLVNNAAIAFKNNATEPFSVQVESALVTFAQNDFAMTPFFLLDLKLRPGILTQILAVILCLRPYRFSPLK